MRTPNPTRLAPLGRVVQYTQQIQILNYHIHVLFLADSWHEIFKVDLSLPDIKLAVQMS